MLRLSSSSTAGLWLSLLRKNTRITFWTMFPPALPVFLSPSPLLYKVLSAFFLLYYHFGCLSRCAQRQDPHIQNANTASHLESRKRLVLLWQHLRLHIGKTKSGCAFATTRQSSEKQREEVRLSLSRRDAQLSRLRRMLSDSERRGSSPALYTLTLLAERGGTKEEIPLAQTHTPSR